MIKPTIPANELERLAALRSYEILDTPPEEAFDDLAKLAAHICGTPSARVSLVDEARQWFKAVIGDQTRETERYVAFCAHGILERDLLIVPDATKDDRFTGNPLVTGASGVQFYAGAPLITAEGHALGMLCVTDQQPRTLTPAQQEALRWLARQTVAQLELRKRTRELQAEVLERREAAAALRLSEERFRHAFDDAAIGMSLVNPDGRFLKVNHALCQMIGYEEAELLALDFQRITHPDDLAADLDLVRRVLAGTIPTYQMEKRYFHKSGPVVFVSLSVSLVRDGEGAPLYFVSQIENITERKKAEEALRISEERFHLVVDGVKDYALLMLDPDGWVVSWNAGAERIKGYRADEIIGKHFSRFYPPDAIAAGHPEVELRIAEREGRYEEKGWRLRKDGSRFFANVVITAIRDPDGTLRGFAKMTRDITETDKHEEQLKLLTQRLSLATRTAGFGVWDWNIKENKVEWDETMFNIYGASRDTTINYEFWKSRVLLEDLAEAEAAVQLVISEKGRGETEFRIRRADGSVRHIQAAMGVALDNDQNVTRMVGVNLDITEQKQREAERDRIIAELQELLMQVKTLSGLIPICGWCKSVRSDTGYWQTVEQYVRNNTSATFSHGICPDCSEKFKDEISKANGHPPERQA